MATVTLLRAGDTHTDLAREALVELHRRTPVDEDVMVQFLRDPARYLLLAIENERVVGSLNGYALRHLHRREPQFLLYELDVQPRCRNRGVGRALVEEFIAEAQAAGAFEVWVLTNQSNEAAVTMYSHCGFHRQNQDDVMLSLTLNNG